MNHVISIPWSSTGYVSFGYFLLYQSLTNRLPSGPTNEVGSTSKLSMVMIGLPLVMTHSN